MAERHEFTEKTKRIIAFRAACLCAFKGCGKTTFGPHADDDKHVNLGQASHITAAAEGGPRYDPDLSTAERRAAANGIWMCLEHAKLIDADPEAYPVGLLRRWKTDAEHRAMEQRRPFLVDSKPHWNVPNRNAFFTGRKDILESLDELFGRSPTASLTQSVVGLGGIGKTQIAVELCHANKDAYPCGIFWADASSAESLKSSYVEFAVHCGWVAAETPVDEAASTWLKRVAGMPGWLLVLDNADEPADIEMLLPRSAEGHVLATTRSHNPGWGPAPLVVDTWSLDEAIQFLIHRTGRNTEQVACGELAEALGRLPLALEQAGAYLQQNSTVDVETYLQGFRRRRVQFLEDRHGRTRLRGDYEHTVAKTWAISFERLPKETVEALQCLAFLDAENIPISFFQACGHIGPALCNLDLGDSLTVSERIVAPLESYSLVRVAQDRDHLSIHRLVQEVLRYSLGASSTSIFEKVHHALVDCFPSEDPRSSSAWPAGRAWMPHVLEGSRLWQKLEETNEAPTWDPTRLWSRAGWMADSGGQYSIARRLHSQVADLLQRTLGKEHPDTLTAVSSLSSTLWAQGENLDAAGLDKKVLEIRRRVLGDDHPDTLTSLNNLATNLKALGDLEGACELHQ